MLSINQPSDLFGQQEEMQWINGRCIKVEVLVEAARTSVFGVHHDSTDADDVGRSQDTTQRTKKERGTEPFALPCARA